MQPKSELKTQASDLNRPSSTASKPEKLTKKVLVIDDSPTIRKIISKLIKKSDLLELHECAGSAAEARKIIEKEEPDLITLDIHMPEMTGVEFLKTYLIGLRTL